MFCVSPPGGVPAVDTMTGGKYINNFNGCVLEIYLQNNGPLRIPQDAVSGYNVLPCY